MHNKYMIVDSQFVVTGSFNWTFTAGKHNWENVVVIGSEKIVQKYSANFQKLWVDFSRNELEMKHHHAAVKIQNMLRLKRQNTIEA